MLDLDFRLTPNCCESTGTHFASLEFPNPIIDNRFSQNISNSTEYKKWCSTSDDDDRSILPAYQVSLSRAYSYQSIRSSGRKLRSSWQSASGSNAMAVMQCHSVVRLVVRASEAGNAGPYTATLYYPLVPRPHWRFRTIGCPATARNRHCGQASLLAQPEIGTVWT